MRMKHSEIMTDEIIDFEKLRSAINEFCSKHKTNYTELSGRLFKSENYISNIFNTRRVPRNVFNGICEICGLDSADFTLQQKKPETAQPVAQQTGKTDFIPATGWSCNCAVHMETSSVDFTLYKDGSVVTRTFSRIKLPRGDKDIVQAISYAAHMAYKQVEQMEFLAQRLSAESRKEK